MQMCSTGPMTQLQNRCYVFEDRIHKLKKHYKTQIQLQHLSYFQFFTNYIESTPGRSTYISEFFWITAVKVTIQAQCMTPVSSHPMAQVTCLFVFEKKALNKKYPNYLCSLG